MGGGVRPRDRVMVDTKRRIGGDQDQRRRRLPLLTLIHLLCCHIFRRHHPVVAAADWRIIYRQHAEVCFEHNAVVWGPSRWTHPHLTSMLGVQSSPGGYRSVCAENASSSASMIPPGIGTATDQFQAIRRCVGRGGRSGVGFREDGGGNGQIKMRWYGVGRKKVVAFFIIIVLPSPTHARPAASPRGGGEGWRNLMNLTTAVW